MLGATPGLVRVMSLSAELRGLEFGGQNPWFSAMHSIEGAFAEGIIVQSTDGRIFSCSPAAGEMLGWSCDPVSRWSAFDPCWHGLREDGSPFSTEDHPVFVAVRTMTPVRGVLMGIRQASGELRWISVNTHVLHVSGVDHVVSSFADVTPLRNALRESERNEALFSLGLQAARVGVWEWVIETNAITWTDEVYRMFAISPGTRVDFAAYMSKVHPDDQDLVRATLRRTLEGVVGNDRYEIEHRIVRGDGRLRWLRGSGHVVRDAVGAAVLMRGAVTDVTEQRTIERRALVTQRLESVGALAGGIAHDFNNLLTALLGAVDEGRAHHDDPNVVLTAFDAVDTACGHAAQLTRNLLAFASRQVLELGDCDLDRLVRDALEALEHGGFLRDEISLSVELGAGDWRVRVNAAQMQQVLVNIVANAQDAMPTGGSLEISVHRVAAGDPSLSADDVHRDWLVVRIHDTGHGIPPDLVERIFEPFFTTKASGAGLGLASCYGIVQQFGGRIACESQPGEGTVFAISLPRAAAHEIEVAMQEPAEGTQSAGRVLVVEDQQPVLRVVERALSRAGFDVLATDSPEHALQLLLDHPDVTVLLSDVVMPELSGPELARRARKVRGDLKIMFMSGYASEAFTDQIQQLNNVTTLEKPFRPADLVAKIRSLMAG